MRDMEHTLRRNAVKAAAQRVMFCPVSKKVLDVDRALLVTDKTSGDTAILSAEAWDSLKWTEKQSCTLEVWRGKDGKELTWADYPEGKS